MSIEKRIEGLERRCRALTAGLLLCCMAIGLAVTAAASTNPKPETLRVSGLEVVDEEGKVRMHLGRGEDYALYALRIVDEDGARRVLLTDRAHLQLVNTGGRASMSARGQRPDNRAGTRGGAVLQLASDGYAPRIMLYSMDTYAGAQIRDSNGKVAFKKESARIENGRDRAAEAYTSDRE